MEDLVELLEFVNNNIRDLINKFSKLSKNNLTIKQMLLIEIIGNIMINKKEYLENIIHELINKNCYTLEKQTVFKSWIINMYNEIGY